MSTVRALLSAAALASTAFVPATAHGAIVLDAQPATPTRVAAYGSTVMWSQLDPATGRYRLVMSEEGRPPRILRRVAQRDTPFDIDLGSGQYGDPVAVYTRDGDIYRFEHYQEHKVTKLSSPLLEERDPTIQRGHIAFIRRDGSSDQLRIGDPWRSSRLLLKRPRIVSAELADKHVAYVEPSPDPRDDALLVHVRNVATGKDRVVYRAGSGGMNIANVTKPSYDDGIDSFVWARTNTGSGTGNRLVRYQIPGSMLMFAQGSASWSSTAWAGTRFGAVTASSLNDGDSPDTCFPREGQGRNYCSVRLTGPVRFAKTP